MSRVRHDTRRGWLLVVAAFAALSLVSGCAGLEPGSAPPGSTIVPAPSGAAEFTQGELRILLMDELGPRWYCDPDVYPVAHGTEQERAIERYDEMAAEDDLFGAVAIQLGINPDGQHSDAQKLAIYRLWKVGISIPLEPIGNDRYRFDYLAQPVGGASEGLRTAGIIDASGAVEIEQQALAGEPICPICLDRRTRIDTPAGPVEVDRLRVGDPIWTLDRAGHIVPGVVTAIGSTPAPMDHRVVDLRLADGRTLSASPGHPLADGRRLFDLAVGDVVDGSRITALQSRPYAEAETFDIAVSGATGAYLAGGIPLGSTLD